jgi:hypothetical protein
MPCPICDDKKQHPNPECSDWIDAIAKEEEQIKEWTDKTPFPTYKEMMRRIIKSNDPIWYAEYGEANHLALKICYESYMDKDMVRKMALSIVNRGGLQALSSNCDVFRYLGPYSTSSNLVVRANGAWMENHSDGITHEGQVFRK